MDVNDKTNLSVIIPCYNSGNSIVEYLQKKQRDHYQCLIEYVIIDDCSSDNSFNILTDYSDKTNLNVVVVKNRANMGPGYSRNIGLKISKCKFVTFMDSDDCFDDNFEEMVFPLLEQNYDCVVFDYYIQKGDKKTPQSIYINGDRNAEPTVNSTLVFLLGSTWGKIYKRDIIIKNNINFLNQKRNEDLPFTKTAVSKCHSIYHINHPLYYYIQNSKSLMHNSTLLDKQNAINAFDAIDSNINGFEVEKEAIFMHEYLYSTCLTALRDTTKQKWEEYVDCVMKRHSINIDNKYFVRFPKKIILVVKMILKKRYFALKFIYLMKTKIMR